MFLMFVLVTCVYKDRCRQWYINNKFLIVHAKQNMTVMVISYQIMVQLQEVFMFRGGSGKRSPDHLPSKCLQES